MSAKAGVGIPAEIAEPLIELHGWDILVVGKDDWEKVKKVLRKHPEAFKEVESLGIKMSPVGIKCRKV